MKSSTNLNLRCRSLRGRPNLSSKSRVRSVKSKLNEADMTEHGFAHTNATTKRGKQNEDYTKIIEKLFTICCAGYDNSVHYRLLPFRHKHRFSCVLFVLRGSDRANHLEMAKGEGHTMKKKTFQKEISLK